MSEYNDASGKEPVRVNDLLVVPGEIGLVPKPRHSNEGDDKRASRFADWLDGVRRKR